MNLGTIVRKKLRKHKKIFKIIFDNVLNPAGNINHRNQTVCNTERKKDRKKEHFHMFCLEESYFFKLESVTSILTYLLTYLLTIDR